MTSKRSRTILDSSPTRFLPPTASPLPKPWREFGASSPTTASIQIPEGPSCPKKPSINYTPLSHSGQCTNETANTTPVAYLIIAYHLYTCLLVSSFISSQVRSNHPTSVSLRSRSSRFRRPFSRSRWRAGEARWSLRLRWAIHARRSR